MVRQDALVVFVKPERVYERIRRALLNVTLVPSRGGRAIHVCDKVSLIDQLEIRARLARLNG